MPAGAGGSGQDAAAVARPLRRHSEDPPAVRRQRQGAHHRRRAALRDQVGRERLDPRLQPIPAHQPRKGE